MDSEVIYKYKVITNIHSTALADSMMQWCVQYEKEHPEKNILWLPYWLYQTDFRSIFVVEINNLDMYLLAKLTWGGVSD